MLLVLWGGHLLFDLSDGGVSIRVGCRNMGTPENSIVPAQTTAAEPPLGGDVMPPAC